MDANGFLGFYRVGMIFFAAMLILDISLFGVSPIAGAWPVCFAYYYMQYQSAKKYVKAVTEEEKND